MILDQPRMVANSDERRALVRSLGTLSNEDIMLAMQAPGVLYVEDYTDLAILREWARILNHRIADVLMNQLFWRRVVH